MVDSESEALLLEHNLIKQFQPRFNVRLKDDKSYPWLAVTVNDDWPRPAVVRGRKRSGVRYFGPYPNVGAIRETLDLLLRSFPVRTCSDTKFRRHERLGRPCLLFHIERCSGPCVGEVDPRGVRPPGGRPHRLPRRGHRAPRAGAGDGHAGGVPEPSSSSGPRSSGTSWRRCGRPTPSARWSWPAARTSTSSVWPRTSWRRRSRCSTSDRARWWAGWPSSWTRWRT